VNPEGVITLYSKLVDYAPGVQSEANEEMEKFVSHFFHEAARVKLTVDDLVEMKGIFKAYLNWLAVYEDENDEPPEVEDAHRMLSGRVNDSALNRDPARAEVALALLEEAEELDNPADLWQYIYVLKQDLEDEEWLERTFDRLADDIDFNPEEFRELAACIEQVRDTEDRVSAICKEVDFFEPIIRRVIDVASSSYKTEYFAERLRRQADELERSQGDEDEDED